MIHATKTDTGSIKVSTATMAELTQALLDIDAILIKASGAEAVSDQDPGFAYRMTIELRLFRALHKTYARRVKKGTKAAVDWFTKRAWPNLTPQDVTGVGKRMREAMDGWAEEVQPVLFPVTREAYLQGKQTIWARAVGTLPPRPTAESPRIVQDPKGRPVIKATTDRAQVKPSFALVDQGAVQVLRSRGLFWINRHYEQHLSERIRLVSQQTIIEQGLGRREAARMLMNELPAAMGMTQSQLMTTIPVGWTGTAVQYMDGIAANVVTTARVAGSFQGLREVGASHYTVVNPSDRRTCSECEFMNGKTFPVEDGASRMDNELATGDPLTIKDQHPWHKLPVILQNTGLKASDTGRVSAGKASALSEGGYGFPSYHFRCRCTIDVAVDASYGSPIGG